MKGSDILFLQYALNQIEGATIELNGVYNAETIAAVKAYQSKIGEQVHGFVTPELVEKLTGLSFIARYIYQPDQIQLKKFLGGESPISSAEAPPTENPVAPDDGLSDDELDIVIPDNTPETDDSNEVVPANPENNTSNFDIKNLVDGGVAKEFQSLHFVNIPEGATHIEIYWHETPLKTFSLTDVELGEDSSYHPSSSWKFTNDGPLEIVVMDGDNELRRIKRQIKAFE